MDRIYDKRGIPVCVGDVLKVFHYKSGSRNVYMYKWVLGLVEDGERTRELAQTRAGAPRRKRNLERVSGGEIERAHEARAEADLQ